MTSRSTCKCIHRTRSLPAGARKEEQRAMPPGAPAGRRAAPARRGLRATRGAVMPDPVLRAQGRGLGAQGPASHPQMGLWASAPRRLGRCTRSSPSHGELWCQASLHPRALQRELPQGPGRPQGRPQGCTHSRCLCHLGTPGQALTAVPCCPPVPGSRWHRALPPTSPWKAGAGVPKDHRGRQPGLRSPGLPRGRLVLSSESRAQSDGAPSGAPR